jgi:rhomboid protease GluP
MFDGDEPILITPDMLARGGAGGPAGRVDFERGMRHAPPLVLALIAANVVIFIWEVATGALTSRERLIQAGALTHNAVFGGEWWRLFSAPFLHGGWDHLIGNCVVLYIVGMGYEHAVGAFRTATVYLMSALSGSAASAVFSRGPSVGASGAIFGVAAALIVTLHRHQDRFYLRDKRIGFVLAAWALYQILIGFSTTYVDNSAHVGGVLGGAAAALLVEPRLLWEQPPS